MGRVGLYRKYIKRLLDVIFSSVALVVLSPLLGITALLVRTKLGSPVVFKQALPDRLVLFFPAKTVFVELKAPGKMLRPLQIKRKHQLNALGFPVLCIDRFSQIKPCIQAILDWTPGEPFPEGIGAKIPELETIALPTNQGSLNDMDDYGDTFEPEDPSELAGFFSLDESVGSGGGSD